MLTVALEDYFQGRAFEGVVDQTRWSRFESRFEKNTIAALDLLRKHRAEATFFVMDSVAVRHPAIVHEVVRQGHEIASAGSSRKSFRQLTQVELREELRRTRGHIEGVTGQKLRGFRVADRRLGPKDLWALETLAEEGFAYDSSLSPSLLHFRTQPWRRFVHHATFGARGIWEVPLTSWSMLGCMAPIAGGNYFRQFPESLIRGAVDRWARQNQAPFVMYFRVWDLDLDQPQITGAPLLARVRHYRNADKMPALLSEFLTRYRFTSIENYLELAAAEPAAIRSPVPAAAPIRTRYEARTPVTVVVPCFNEEESLPYLANTLRELDETLDHAYELRYIFVNDGSSDGTLALLRKLFADETRFTVLDHGKNRGVAAAILSGIRAARTQIVCSIDCDCTYDPRELRHMIPMLRDGIDMVTASPYHPLGSVVNVPGWRLALSRGASWIYGLILRQPIHTYTSCFRVYRRDRVTQIELHEKGFLGIAELVGEMTLRGSKMVEHPATLETRMLGTSKMRVARTLVGHLRLMARLTRQRLAQVRKVEREATPAELPETTEIIKT